MLIPLRTSRPQRRKPLVTELLIIANLLVFLAVLVAERAGAGDRFDLVGRAALARDGFRVWQLVSYQFLHDPGQLWHLAFNMLFLWVFGGAVEDRLRRTSFLAFYLIGGAVAGLAHTMLDPSPVIGASGSVAAVSGAFLALFPRSHIRVLIVFFFIGVYSIPSVWFIGLYFAIDLLRGTKAILGGAEDGQVAYAAHLAGYLYGFALAFALLGLGIVKREEYDVFFLFKQWRRRAAFRAASRAQVGGAWESASADTGRDLARRRKRAPEPSPAADAHAARRAEIAQLVADHKLPAAAAAYRALLVEAPEATLPERQQLDVANQLQAEGDHEGAAGAYELLLRAYSTCASAPEVRLILGAIYARRLDRPQRARELIELARAALTDPGQRSLADDLLGEIAP